MTEGSIASDEAVFFHDLVQQGCGFHLAHGQEFLCRQKDGKWENALIYHMTNFPEREVIEEDGVSCSMGTRLWIEPDMWQPLDLAPNQPIQEGLTMFGIMASSSRFPNMPREEQDRLWKLLIERCSGKKHSEVLGKNDTWEDT